MIWIAKAMWPNGYCVSELGQEFFDRTGNDIRNQAYLCAPTLVGSPFASKQWAVQIKNSLNVELFICISTFGTFVTLTVVIDVLCAMKIISALKNTSQHSQTVVKKQKRLFALLILQLLLPFLFNLLPENLIIGLTYLGYPMGNLAYISSLFSVAQVIDPLLILYFIKPYRMALLRCVNPTRVTSSSIHGSLPPVRVSSHVSKT